MSDTDYAEYRCSACKKEVKNLVVQCKSCVRFFFHPGCAFKHKIYKGNELVKCEGPFEQIVLEDVKAEMKKTDISRKRMGSIGSTGTTTNASGSTNIQANVDTKIDWLIKTVREIRDEVACKSEIKTMIKQLIRDELENFKKELEDVKRSVRVKTTEIAGNEIKSYSEAVIDKKRESILIVKPKTEQESETTKKLVKENVDIKNLAVGITKIKKGGKGSSILGCESERDKKVERQYVRI